MRDRARSPGGHGPGPGQSGLTAAAAGSPEHMLRAPDPHRRPRRARPGVLQVQGSSRPGMLRSAGGQGVWTRCVGRLGSGRVGIGRPPITRAAAPRLRGGTGSSCAGRRHRLRGGAGPGATAEMGAGLIPTGQVVQILPKLLPAMPVPIVGKDKEQCVPPAQVSPRSWGAGGGDGSSRCGTALNQNVRPLAGSPLCGSKTPRNPTLYVARQVRPSRPGCQVRALTAPLVRAHPKFTRHLGSLLVFVQRRNIFLIPIGGRVAA